MDVLRFLNTLVLRDEVVVIGGSGSMVCGWNELLVCILFEYYVKWVSCLHSSRGSSTFFNDEIKDLNGFIDLGWF